jgi:hypothetical protein
LQEAFKNANFIKDNFKLAALVNKMNLKKIVSVGLCFFIKEASNKKASTSVFVMM